MAKKAKLGSGKRFAALKRKVGSSALAAFIGRKKFGKAKFAKLSAGGRKPPKSKATRHRRPMSSKGLRDSSD